MDCLICNSPMRSFLTKGFAVTGLDRVEYLCCGNCGFVWSKTHANLPPALWEKINFEVHSDHLINDSIPKDDPLWISRLEKQARVISDVIDIGLILKHGPWVDYACGNGKLSEILFNVYRLTLLKYEQYMVRRAGYLLDTDLVPGSFSFVITTSVFEHFVNRAQFDAVEALAAPTGVLGFHTLICEEVPCDPMWFYMNPVHSAFHTNRSMEIMLRQWGYTCSVYNVEAKLWLCFKGDAQCVREAIAAANQRPQGLTYVFKEGFVDYWKSSPLQRSFEPKRPVAPNS